MTLAINLRTTNIKKTFSAILGKKKLLINPNCSSEYRYKLSTITISITLGFSTAYQLEDNWLNINGVLFSYSRDYIQFLFTKACCHFRLGEQEICKLITEISALCKTF